MKISHSGVSEYLECSEKFRLNRIEKLRPIAVSSTLLFGGAIDEGLNELLKTKLAVDPEILPRPMTAFYSKWHKSEINGQLQDLKFNTLIEYSKKDLDLNLFNEDDWDAIKAEYPDENPQEFAAYIEAERLKHPWWSYSQMDENAKIAYNFLCWLSLARKAEYIFEAYSREVLPRIKVVLAIQEEILLENDEIDPETGEPDVVKGFADFRAIMDDGFEYIADNKTTSDFKYYKEDCIKTSEQLNLYSFALNVPRAMYVAILKEIKADGRKKGSLPTVKIKLRMDLIDVEGQEKTIEKFNVANKNIKAGVFKKLAEESMCFFFGKACPYAKLCWGGSMEGLVKKEVKE